MLAAVCMRSFIVRLICGSDNSAIKLKLTPINLSLSLPLSLSPSLPSFFLHLSLSIFQHPSLSALLHGEKKPERHANNLINGRKRLRPAVRRGYLLTPRHLRLVPIHPCAAFKGPHFSTVKLIIPREVGWGVCVCEQGRGVFPFCLRRRSQCAALWSLEEQSKDWVSE